MFSKNRDPRIHSKAEQLLFIIVFVGMLLAACSSAERAPLPATPTAIVFRPPTVDPLIIQLEETEAARLTAESPPTPTPACTNGLEFVEDVTIEDGSVVSPGQRLDKRWKIFNAGTCNWDARYEIQLIAGPAMDAPISQALFPALSGVEAEIRMIFYAPNEPGSYRSAWQAFDPRGNPFGDAFFIDIVVAQGDS